MFVSLTRTVR